MTTYAVDIIGSVIFGLEIDSFSNPKNEFREISSSTSKDKSLLLKIHNMSMFICPPWVRELRTTQYILPWKIPKF